MKYTMYVFNDDNSFMEKESVDLPDFPVHMLIDKLTNHIDIRYAGTTRFYIPDDENAEPFIVKESKHENSYLNEEYHKGVNY